MYYLELLCEKLFIFFLKYFSQKRGIVFQFSKYHFVNCLIFKTINQIRQFGTKFAIYKYQCVGERTAFFRIGAVLGEGPPIA